MKKTKNNDSAGELRAYDATRQARDRMLLVRITSSEQAQLKELAEAHDLSVSAYVRCKCLDLPHPLVRSPR